MSEDRNLIHEQVKAIAFYLPQFHPIPENDKWWGNNFTEWTNVRKAKPLFEGHYQPHAPHDDIRYYDLRDIEVQKKQAEMAKKYGIYGFCYYHYWFEGKKLLETPLQNLLQHQEIDFPFCICWANENWSRRWDGCDQEILISQNHSKEDDLAFIEDLFPALQDKRYIKVNGKPLVVVYRPGLLPNPKETMRIWREAVKKKGIGDLYIVRVENFDKGIPPEEFGCDAAINFEPNFETCQSNSSPKQCSYDDILVDDILDFYRYPIFKCLCPGWDNTARRGMSGAVFVGSSPEKYAYWLRKAVEYTVKKFRKDERFLFFNAWNEWGEGAHLEPDKKYGYAYLEATSRVLNGDFHQDMEVFRIMDYVLERVEIERAKETRNSQNIIQQKENDIVFMQSSKFWKLRSLYLKLRKK